MDREAGRGLSSSSSAHCSGACSRSSYPFKIHSSLIPLPPLLLMDLEPWPYDPPRFPSSLALVEPAAVAEERKCACSAFQDFKFELDVVPCTSAVRGRVFVRCRRTVALSIVVVIVVVVRVCVVIVLVVLCASAEVSSPSSECST